MFLGTVLAASLVTFGLGLQAAPPPEPHLQTLSPNRGNTAGGTVVELRGENFDLLPPGTLGVVFGYDPATNVQKVSPTLITAVSPPHHQGQVYVKISISGDPKQGYGRRGFTYDEDAPVNTTSTTTTLPGQTTTTTLGCGNCADGDPCTLDACASNSCQHLTSASPTLLVGQARACNGEGLPAIVGIRFARGCQLVDDSDGAPGPGAKRRALKKAIRVYGKAIKATRRASHRPRAAISAGCASGLEGLLESARSRAKALKGP